MFIRSSTDNCFSSDVDGAPLSAGSVPYDQLSKDIDAEIAKKK